MKKVTKFFMAALLAGMCNFGYAQTQPDYMKAPKPNEKVLGTISFTTEDYYEDYNKPSDQNLYILLLDKAKKEYPGRVIDIRDLAIGKDETKRKFIVDGTNSLGHTYGHSRYGYQVVGKVVYTPDPQTQTKENLSQALNKALRNVREGSRMAIDQVTVLSSMDRGEFKDQLIDVLLDKGYKVVAKEYLEKLYEEQQAQQSGIYNDRTTVQENNFSAVGYYINVKVTETSLRVQVVNVSTGEYEGNATVNF